MLRSQILGSFNPVFFNYLSALKYSFQMIYLWKQDLLSIVEIKPYTEKYIHIFTYIYPAIFTKSQSFWKIDVTAPSQSGIHSSSSSMNPSHGVGASISHNLHKNITCLTSKGKIGQPPFALFLTTNKPIFPKIWPLTIAEQMPV